MVHDPTTADESRLTRRVDMIRLRADVTGALAGELRLSSSPTEGGLERTARQAALALAAAVRTGRGERRVVELGFREQRRLLAGEQAEPLMAAYQLAPGPAPGGQPVEASFVLAADDGAAEAWLRLPDESSLEFFEVMAQVSARIQQTLRIWVPLVYFSAPELYDDVEAAAPMLVYQASRPFPGRPKTEFTYDVLNPASRKAAIRSAGGSLPATLARTRALLAAIGRRGTATRYTSSRGRAMLAEVRRQPARLCALLAGESHLVEEFIQLAGAGRALGRRVAADADLRPMEIARPAANLARRLHHWLRRLHGRSDFTALGPLLVVEATAALANALGMPAGRRAELRLRGEGWERVFSGPAAATVK